MDVPLIAPRVRLNQKNGRDYFSNFQLSATSVREGRYFHGVFTFAQFTWNVWHVWIDLSEQNIEKCFQKDIENLFKNESVNSTFRHQLTSLRAFIRATPEQQPLNNPEGNLTCIGKYILNFQLVKCPSLGPKLKMVFKCLIFGSYDAIRCLRP